MKLNLLKILAAVCDNDFAVSKTAQKLNLPQPTVSRALLDLEREIGRALFIRRGKRIIDITPMCREVLVQARQMLVHHDNIIKLCKQDILGSIRIGTTHVQARYVLPAVARRYLREYERANIQIYQDTPASLVQMAESNAVDIVMCTEALENHISLQAVNAYRWNRSLIMPKSHPLARDKTITLKKLAACPLVTYVHGFTGRDMFDATFRKVNLSPSVIVAASDSDVIKTYVRMGAGVGVIASVSYQSAEDKDLVCRPLSHLFPDMWTRMAYHRRKVITESMQRFMDLVTQHCKTQQKKFGAKAARR